jgi:magnesium chelatase family protein
MLAERLPGILPPPSELEALATAVVHSAAGLPLDLQRWRQRPFRAPHHSCSAAALVGGGRLPRPGEISLAHNGVLFLDELPEFNRYALEALREPLESAVVTEARERRVVRFPAAFVLIAAMNPCPCGYVGDPRIACRCSPERIARYRARISGPLIERIDLHVEVPRQTSGLIAAGVPGEASTAVRARISALHELQRARQGGLNARLAGADLARHCPLTSGARKLLARSLEQLPLSARAFHKILRLGRTLADLESLTAVAEQHVAEAISLRMLDRRTDPAGSGM